MNLRVHLQEDGCTYRNGPTRLLNLIHVHTYSAFLLYPSDLTNFSQSSLCYFCAIFILLFVVLVFNKVFHCFVLYILSVRHFLFFYCKLCIIILHSEPFPVLQFLCPMLSSAALEMACLIFHQFIYTFPVLFLHFEGSLSSLRCPLDRLLAFQRVSLVVGLPPSCL